MKDGTRRSTSGTYGPRGAGTYVPQACQVCRLKKIKCDGNKPQCDTCVKSDRGDECHYNGKVVGRRPPSQAHFQSLQSSLDASKSYITQLEHILERCIKDYPGSHAEIYRTLRPAGLEDPLTPEETTYELDSNEDDMDDRNPADELCLPTENLTLVEEGGLLHHGATAPFRYLSEPLGTRTNSRLSNVTEDPNETYTLLVEGSDQSHFNPHLDWSRYLPPDIPLDRAEHDTILDLTFKYLTSWCLRIIPSLFLRDMCRALTAPKIEPSPPTSHYSPMLHNALIAVASAYSSDPRIQDLQTRRRFADKAKSYSEAECSRPSLCVVTALSLIAIFYSGQGEQTLGYLYFGMSARMSQVLGLNIDCSRWVEHKIISEEDRMDRNWGFWTTFCQDVSWSLYVGRDFCTPVPPYPDSIPFFVDAEFDQKESVYNPGTPPQPGYLSTTFVATMGLLKIARGIMNVINALDNPVGTGQIACDRLITKIDLDLHSWSSKLPDEINNNHKMRRAPTPHVLQLHLTYNWCFILLHRPFLSRKARAVAARDGEIDHVKSCRRAASEIMDLLELWRNKFTLRYAPITLVQTVFSAGTIYMIFAVQAVRGTRPSKKILKSSIESARLCIRYLMEIGNTWQCANNIAACLKDWLQNHVQPIIRQRRVFSPGNSVVLPKDNPPPVTSSNAHRAESTSVKHQTTKDNADSRKRNMKKPGDDHSQLTITLSPPQSSHMDMSNGSVGTTTGTLTSGASFRDLNHALSTPLSTTNLRVQNGASSVPSPISEPIQQQDSVPVQNVEPQVSSYVPSNVPTSLPSSLPTEQNVQTNGNGIFTSQVLHQAEFSKPDATMYDATSQTFATSPAHPHSPIHQPVASHPANSFARVLGIFDPNVQRTLSNHWGPASCSAITGERPLSPVGSTVSYHRAMPNGRPLDPTLFLLRFGLDIDSNGESENNIDASESVHDFGMGYVGQEQEARGREGWEILEMEEVEEEELNNWFNWQ